MKSNETRRTRLTAFTLVELLVVISIIALLVTILIPNLSGVQESARQAICKSNLHAMGVGYASYFGIYNGITPRLWNATWDDSSPQANYLVYDGKSSHSFVGPGALFGVKLISDGRTFVCPTTEKNKAHEWYTDPGGVGNQHGGWDGNLNPWPSVNGWHTRMTYGVRRMKTYDPDTQSDVAASFPTAIAPPNIQQYLMCASGVSGVPYPSKFSFMSDNLNQTGMAQLTHVFAANILYLDGHAAFFNYSNVPVISSDLASDCVWMNLDTYSTK